MLKDFIDTRSAGVILPVFSLPSPYGIGDMGPAAYRFVDFLANSGLQYWQILPVNYTDEGAGYSPYSCLSAFAGNVLLISPELLKADKLLEDEDSEEMPNSSTIEYAKVKRDKAVIFEKAFRTFKRDVHDEYILFCKNNYWWLDDFALFKVIKDHFGKKSWADWPERLRDRDVETLQEITNQLSDEIEKEKFLQFIFYSQWSRLKKYAEEKGVYLIGDIPFYIGYESADVWSFPEFFKLDENKRSSKVGGTPPDDFSKTGQLWGMPAYNWDALKEKKYSWWMKRIEQNLALCSIVRLDHFRAFAACWEVSATDKTAKNGSWVPVPGADFFHQVKEKYPSLPFIAEDLGTIDQPVYDLINAFGFPGMKVLHFAFSGDATNVYLPYFHTDNNVVYTGTHDNNTTRGWYEELNKGGKKYLKQYIGRKIKKSLVHLHLTRIALQSVARLAIIPVQDFLGLGSEAVLNRPATSDRNWMWKLNVDMSPEIARKINRMLLMSGRLKARIKEREQNKDKEKSVQEQEEVIGESNENHM